MRPLQRQERPPAKKIDVPPRCSRRRSNAVKQLEGSLRSAGSKLGLGPSENELGVRCGSRLRADAGGRPPCPISRQNLGCPQRDPRHGWLKPPTVAALGSAHHPTALHKGAANSSAITTNSDHRTLQSVAYPIGDFFTQPVPSGRIPGYIDNHEVVVRIHERYGRIAHRGGRTLGPDMPTRLQVVAPVAVAPDVFD